MTEFCHHIKHRISRLVVIIVTTRLNMTARYIQLKVVTVALILTTD